MKQLKHLRQTLWRALLCLTVVVGFAAPGWAKTVYWDNSEANWSSVYAYLYTGSTTNTLKQATQVTIDGQTLYSVDAENYSNVIFKPQAGLGQNDWSNQTGDLATTDGYVFGKKNIKNGDSSDATPVGKIADGEFIAHIGSALYIGVGTSAENNSGSRTSLVEDGFFKGYTFNVADSQKFMFYSASSYGSWFGANGSVQTVTTDGTEYLAKGYNPTKAFQINNTGKYKLKIISYDGSQVKLDHSDW